MPVHGSGSPTLKTRDLIRACPCDTWPIIGLSAVFTPEIPSKGLDIIHRSIGTAPHLAVDVQLDLVPVRIEDVHAFRKGPLGLVEDGRSRGIEHLAHETERLG